MPAWLRPMGATVGFPRAAREPPACEHRQSLARTSPGSSGLTAGTDFKVGDEGWQMLGGQFYSLTMHWLIMSLRNHLNGDLLGGLVAKTPVPAGGSGSLPGSGTKKAPHCS